MQIIKNSVNAVVLTLNEKKVGTADCDWLLEFINESSGETKVLSVVDLSAYPDRYNLFAIDEAADISLSPPGTWRYKAYQMAQASPKDTDPLNAIALCEEDMCMVIDTTDNPVVSFDKDDTKDNAVFDK